MRRATVHPLAPVVIALLLSGCTASVEEDGFPFPEGGNFTAASRTFNLAIDSGGSHQWGCVTVTAAESAPLVGVLANAQWSPPSDQLRISLRTGDREVAKVGGSPLEITLDPEYPEPSFASAVLRATGPVALGAFPLRVEIHAAYDGDTPPTMVLAPCE